MFTHFSASFIRFWICVPPTCYFVRVRVFVCSRARVGKFGASCGTSPRSALWVFKLFYVVTCVERRSVTLLTQGTYSIWQLTFIKSCLYFAPCVGCRMGGCFNVIKWHPLVASWSEDCVYYVCFRGADCDTDHCMVVVEVRERLAVSKQAEQKFDVKRFNLRKLNERKLANSIRQRSQTGLQLWRT